MLDENIKQYHINDCNQVFKLPISYLENKSDVAENIFSDLELTNMKDNSDNCLYNYIFEPKSKLSNITNKMWSRHFTNNTLFLKESQELYKSIKNIKTLSTTEIDELNEMHDEIKNDYSFKDKYNYVEWNFLEYLNYNSFFLLILCLLNITSPLFSIILPLIILCVPIFFLRLKGINISFQEYIRILSFFGKIIPVFNVFNFQQMSIDKKIMTSVSIVIYLFTFYQNTMSVYRFYKNMICIHKYIERIKNFNEITIYNINNYLQYSDELTCYNKFNKELIKYRSVIEDLNNKLKSIKPYSFSIQKLFDLGNVMSNLYLLYSNSLINESLLYSFGFYGYLENILSLQENIKNKHIHHCEFTNKDLSFKKSYYAPLKNENPVTNNFDLKKNIVITGPNAAGKTTLLKSTLFNIILSQQIGFGFYESAKINPYDYIHCYLNIPDTSNRDSLFQAEARRCKNIIDNIDYDKNKRHFCIFDELYSGTNPYEAVASAVSYLDYICNNNNVTFILTTHYVELCKKLYKIQKTRVVNKHMKVNKDNFGDFKFTYKLINKISNIKGGIKVLKDLNYPTKIINSTKEIIYC